MIACVAVNDAFVMGAWGESQKAGGKVRMLADPNGEFTKVLMTRSVHEGMLKGVISFF